MKAWLFAAGITILPAGAQAQPLPVCDPLAAAKSIAAFVDCAVAGTAKYRDQAVATVDGYRRIGRDFPAMGEHWIRVSLVFDGKVDPARPEVLNYVVIASRPQLVGVGYAVPLLPGEAAPEWPAGREAWHDHFRTIEDETVLPHHHARGHVDDSPRLAMMHAWIWTPNPDGVFAADNWGIPFLRLGLSPPADGAPAAAKALSLAWGADYFEMSIEAAATPSATEKRKVANALTRARTTVESLLNNRTGGALSRRELTALEDAWNKMWTTVDAALSAEARRHLEHMPIR